MWYERYGSINHDKWHDVQVFRRGSPMPRSHLEAIIIFGDGFLEVELLSEIRESVMCIHGPYMWLQGIPMQTGSQVQASNSQDMG